MTSPWNPAWYDAAATVAARTASAEGGVLYPQHGATNNAQAGSSAYAGRTFDTEDGRTTDPRPAYEANEYAKQQAQARIIADLCQYIMVKMEPTDRCLRPPGDIYYPADWKFAREIDGKWVPYSGE